MSKDLHTLDVLNGSSLAKQDRIVAGIQAGIPNVIGAGAGLAVVVPVAFAGLPANYCVAVNPGQDATWYITNKTANGFNVNLLPRIATNTLAVGAIDVIVFA